MELLFQEGEVHENSSISELLGEDLCAEDTGIYASLSHCKSGEL